MTLDEILKADDDRALQKFISDASLDINTHMFSGETLLHAACRRCAKRCVALLLDLGADPAKRSQKGWKVMADAVYGGNRDIVTLVFLALKRQAWARWKRGLPRLLSTLAQTDDFYVELKWEVVSNFIPFFSSFAPSDTYRLWKRGTRVRCDSTLVGFSGLRSKRGHVTLLFQGCGDQMHVERDDDEPDVGVYVVDHERRVYTDATEELRDTRLTATSDEAIDELLEGNVVQADFDTSNITLDAAKGWFGAKKSEDVCGFIAKPYTMDGIEVTLINRGKRKSTTKKEKSNSRRGSRSGPEPESPTPGDSANTEGGPLGSEAESDSDEDGGGTEADPTSERGHRRSSSRGSSSSSKPWAPWRRGSKKDKHLASSQAGSASGGNAVAESGGGGDGNGEGEDRSSPSEAGGCEVEEVNLDDLRVAERLKAGMDSGESSWNGDIEGIDFSGAKDEDDVRRRLEKAAQDSKESSQKKSRVRKNVSASLWLTDSFPIPIDSVVAILRAFSPSSKRLRRVKEIVDGHLPEGHFPIKASIPLVPTVSAEISFNAWCLHSPPEKLFWIPKEYGQGEPQEGDVSHPRSDNVGKIWYVDDEVVAKEGGRDVSTPPDSVGDDGDGDEFFDAQE
eukprot:Rmarinus@m.5594